jgi:hypothetical protein
MSSPDRVELPSRQLPSKQTKILFARVDHEMAAAVEKAAKADARTTSGLIRAILGQWLRERSQVRSIVTEPIT